MCRSKKMLILIAVLFGCYLVTPTLALQTPSVSPTGTEQESGLQDRKIRLLDLTGTPYERGKAHGEALKSEIHDMIGEFKKELESSYQVDASIFIERFIEHTDFKPAIEKWTPGLLDEVRGIADGADVPFDEIYVFQLADEIWSMGKWAMKHKCTAIAVSRRDGQPTIVAQTMDIPGFYQKYPTVLRIHCESGPDVMVLTCPGLIGVNGMNDAGVAVCCNTLLQLKPSQEGLPCLFVVRGVLDQKNLTSAESWLKQIPHAVGQNYTIGDPTRATAYECSATTQVPFRPVADGDFTYHTNHPLVNTDWHPDYLAKCKSRNCDPKTGFGNHRRFVALQNRIQEGEPITEQVIVDALASRDHAQGPICGDWNYACTVFVLGETPELHIAPGRADRYRMQTFRFK